MLRENRVCIFFGQGRVALVIYAGDKFDLVVILSPVLIDIGGEFITSDNDNGDKFITYNK